MDNLQNGKQQDGAQTLFLGPLESHRDYFWPVLLDLG